MSFSFFFFNDSGPPEIFPFPLPHVFPISFARHTGAIVGTVYLNRSAEAAPQVAVNIRSLSSGTIRTVLTDFGGHFEINQIPQGTYEVSSSEQGHGFASTIAEEIGRAHV